MVRSFDEEGLRTPLEVGSRGKPLSNQAVDAAIGTALPGFQQLSALCPPETADLPLIHRHLRHVADSDNVLRRPVETTSVLTTTHRMRHIRPVPGYLLSARREQEMPEPTA